MQIETVEVACSTCGSRDADEVGRSRDHEFATCDNEFVFVRCRACGLTYLRNRPAPHTLGTIYPPSYYRYAAFLGPVTTRLRAVVQGGRVRMLRRWLSPGATVMEVGCGEGQLLQAIKADGDPSWRVVGVDISEDACEALRRTGLEMRCAQFEDLDWPASTVDLVIMNQVIEHLADPRACVARAAALLRPGGRLLIETPSVGSWDRDWVAADRWGGWHCPRHWSLYTRDSLSGLLEQQGLRVERTEYLLSPFIWAHTLQNVVRDRPAWRWASGVLSERSVPALLAYGVLDTVQRWTRGRTSNMRVVARKS
ncbi:putative S-adenosylmethionine-dependent methyltransferase [Luteitalea pratensis]|uniref:Putative S-adenosylmethionine-dependent methyltransferase n=1 Tax=Luteitalea pratensis TaxID=1855912 RepID=A0A143PUX7_LUTPR|nr:class I SAM-dependent methyltransferase [Luteitalea pratensis]AMY11634.1 putative S-adenosylmethionine-dependent methyltransferase [Luteitalea pratensis]